MEIGYEEFIKNILQIEERVRLELLIDGKVEAAPKELKRFGVRWVWHNRVLERPVTVQCVVSDIEHIMPGAWLELEHKRDSFPRPMDSWAKRVYGEILVYVSPSRGKGVIFATNKLRAAYKANWIHLERKEVRVSGGTVIGISIPWDSFASYGTEVVVQ